MSKKEINEALERFNSLYAKGGLVNLGENPRYPDKVLTGRPSLDYVTDGGLPRGRVILIAGEESSGKSSLTIQIAEKLGKKILYIDTESTLTTDYIESLGADPFNFTHAIPSTTEEMCNITRKHIPNFDVIIWDSINNSASVEQLQKLAEEKTMANRANVLSAQLPILVGMCNQYNTSLIILSQVRENMDKANKYSPDTVVPGGRSLHHNSSLTLELFRSSLQKTKDIDPLSNRREDIEGNMVRIRCTKNKVGKANREVTIKFTYGKGYTEEADISSSAVRLGIINRSGSWYSYEGTTLCQGEDNIAPLLEDNPELKEELKLKIEEYGK